MLRVTFATVFCVALSNMSCLTVNFLFCNVSAAHMCIYDECIKVNCHEIAYLDSVFVSLTVWLF